MAASDNEDELLRSVALQNAQSILAVRGRAEEALRRQSEWLRITLESIGDAVISTDAQGNVTLMNGVAELLTGWLQREALGRPVSEICRIVNDRTRETIENPVLRALGERAVVGLSNHSILIARDGTERFIDDSAAPMYDEKGETIGAVMVFRDVTERARTEEVRARLAAIVESSDDAIVSKTLDGVIRSWNSGAERLFGYTAQEAVGQSITLIIPPERRDEETEIIARLKLGERIDHFETIRLAKDGRRLEISLTVSPVMDQAGQVIGASKIARDITERAAAMRALRESEERLRLLAAEAARAAEANAKFRAFFDQGTNFAGVLTLGGIVVEANRLCLDACGFTRDDVIGKPFWDCPWWNRSAALVQMVKEASLQAAAGRQSRTETNYFVADGSERIVDLILAPVTDDAGRVLFVAASGSDVTERRRMEDMLREQDRRKDEFLALLAHELRNPLAPLRNGLEVMRLAEGDVRAVSQCRGMMERQLGHMVRLIDDLLDISRINRNKMELRRSRVNLADVISSAVETARPMIEAAGHQFTLSLPKEPILIDADLTRLAQVFSNLLTNSAKYTNHGGHISLSAERKGEDVVVSVSDDGIGIPADSLRSIFDMFSQVDRSIERATGGLGIGLALVKGLVEMHGGSVIAQSGSARKGSTFTVRLPIFCSQAKDMTGEQERGPDRKVSGQRILVVDDHRDSAKSMAKVLNLRGNEVRIAHDGIDAFRAADEFRPDVILMDVGMPRQNGYDATRSIRGQDWGRSITIIALTGWGQEGDRVQSRAAGCDGHLVKPVDFRDLEQLLATLREEKACLM